MPRRGDVIKACAGYDAALGARARQQLYLTTPTSPDLREFRFRTEGARADFRSVRRTGSAGVASRIFLSTPQLTRWHFQIRRGCPTERGSTYARCSTAWP